MHLRMRALALALLLAAGLAQAQSPPRLLNLLTAVPTTIAVSSVVANANLVPEHLVDGQLSTAWNSKTGELVDAWIAVRLPAEVQVKTIKLAAGFIHKKPSGDLFTMDRVVPADADRAWPAGARHPEQGRTGERRGQHRVELVPRDAIGA